MRDTSTSPTSLVGRRLRAARIEVGFTQEEVARRAGYTRNHICKLERGDRDINVDKLVAFSRIFNRDIVYFLQDIKK